MKRDRRGKFIRNWDSEPKQAVNLSLTSTAWQVLQQQACEYGISRSELVERYARSLQSDCGNDFDENEQDEETLQLGDRNLENNLEVLIAQRDTLQAQIEQLQRTIEVLQQQNQNQIAPGDRKVVDIIESISDAFIAFDREWRYTYVNQEAVRLLKKSKEELIGQCIWELFPDLCGTKMEQMLKKAVDEQTAFVFEDYYAPFDIWGEVHAYPSTDGLSLFVRDITERKRAEEAQDNQRQWLEAVLNLLPIPLIFVEPETARFTFSNQAVKQMAGREMPSDRSAGVYDAEFYCTDATGQLIPPDQLPAIRVARGERIDGAELNWHTPNGVYSLLVYGDTLPAMHNRPTTGVIVFQDIRDRKQVESQLQQSHRFIQQVADATPGLLYVYDLIEQRNVYVNCQITEVLGYTPTQVQAMGSELFAQLMHPDDFAILPAQIERLNQAQDGEIIELEYRMRHASGEWHWLLSRDLVFTRTDDGLPSQIIGISHDITERKRAEAALRQVEERLQLALSSAQIIAWDVDLQTNYVMCSPNALDAWGLQEATTEELLAILHPEDKQSVIEAYERALSGEESFTQEYRVISPDGAVRWFHDLGRVYLNADGQAVRIVGVSVDITARKQAEVALHLTQERYRSLAESLPQLVCTARIDGKADYCNQSWIEYTGLELTQTQGLGWLQAIHVEDRSLAVTQSMQAFKTGKPHSIELRLRRVDGVYRWHLVRIVTIKSEDGNFIGWLGTATDINDQKHIEQTQRFLAQASQTFVAASLDLQTILDTITRLVSEFTGDVCTLSLVSEDGQWLNPVSFYHIDSQVRELFGELLKNYPRRADQGMGGQVMQTGEAILLTAASPQELSAAIKPDYQVEFERFRVCSILLVPLKVQGQAIGILSLSRHYPGQPHNHDDQTLMQDLADRAAMAIANARLYEAQQRARAEAEAANRTKDEFLAVLSHELRTPLNPILGWTKLLRRGKIDASKTALALETIERNAKLQVQLIEDLLDISRILQGKLILNSCQVDLVSTINAAIETVHLAAEAKTIHIETNFAADAGNVLGDAGRLQQVFWNLLSNAVKFTPTGGRVEIRLNRSGSQAQVQVQDTGRGINPEFLPYVFDYFRQSDSSITRTFGGLGLGLAIARHIVELHGGTITAASSGMGQGATFTVSLPLMLTPTPIAEEVALTSGSLSLQGIQVLAVDDEADNLELIAFVLKQAGATVICAASAPEALQILNQTQPDILLSDIGMPQMDGYTLLRQIRAMPSQGAQIPAIALTAYAGESDQQQILAAGFRLHIPKPVDPEVLVKAIAQVVRPNE
ncbi:PAS domain S-box protein [Chlorogloeopsis sp. ULAP01]|uniref:PAS domain S-box protein n=1 Tax=Chlorogloeopsis sp. ULAP01 TaxID=3056483 RepID=UPI0025AA56D5|nr:PAS domain S-box protein [Chlorogloeopsis sp. ULAP01]MDM9382318.1 PAS domain S-box protein [Chlorogloeopsis sp. ULAP01]